MAVKKRSLGENLQKIEEIVDWLESQGEVDVEQALEKIKEGAILIKESKLRLKSVENEFEEIKKELEAEGE